MKPYEPNFFHFLILSLFFFLSVSSIRADTEAKCGLWIHVELIHLRWSLFPRWLSGDVSKYFPLSDETWDFSWDIRFYHEKRDRRFSSGGPSTRKSPVLRESLMSHAFAMNPTRVMRHDIFSWGMRCLMRQETGDFI